MPKASPPYTRLLSNYRVNSSTECWEWKGLKGSSGYGHFKVFGKFVGCHRYSYELHNGYIPEGMEVIHSCDNRICINPDHLSVGTHSQNMKEAKDRNRIRKGQNHPSFGREGRKGEKSSQSIRVFVKGKIYESINEAEKQLNIGHGSVRYWIKNKPEIARIVAKKETK